MKQILILILLILCCSCGTSHKVNDSTDRRTVVRLSTVNIPEVKAELQIPVARLAEMPAGAAFVKKEKHATATVRVVRDTLLVTAECDSLASLVYSYEQLMQNRHDEEKVRSPPETPLIGKSLLSYLLIIAITIVATLLMRAKLN